MRGLPYGFEVAEHCSACAWRTSDFFCELDPKTLHELEAFTFTTVYPAGSVLFAEGDECRGVMMLCHGKVKMSMGSSDGKTIIVRVANAGEILGTGSAMSDDAYDVTAETIEPAQVKFIRKDDFRRFLNTHPEVCCRVSRQLARECGTANEHVRALGLAHSAAEKLARLLLEWCQDGGRETAQGIRVRLLVTHHDIAQMIGTSRETVTRLLGSFRDRGILSIKGASLTIHNRAALEAMVLL